MIPIRRATSSAVIVAAARVAARGASAGRGACAAAEAVGRARAKNKVERRMPRPGVGIGSLRGVGCSGFRGVQPPPPAAKHKLVPALTWAVTGQYVAPAMTRVDA